MKSRVTLAFIISFIFTIASWKSIPLAHAQNTKVMYVPGSTVKIAQLIGEYDRERKIPTLNQTQSRYKLFGTDLGVPFRHHDRIYILFGDTQGANSGDAIAFTTDTIPGDGLELNFIHDLNGTYLPIKIPGISQKDFEVPITGVSVGGKMYIYHSTDHSDTVVMGRTVLAVLQDRLPTFTYLYDVSQKYFINIALVKVDAARLSGLPQNKDTVLVMFGSGKYRDSDVRLAVQPADSIESRGSIRYFAGTIGKNIPVWSLKEDDAVTLFSQPCVGELSLAYNKFIKKWIMLYNCHLNRGINFRTADVPWGPWSEPQVLFNPRDDNGYCHFMHVAWTFQKCDSVHDPGRENEWGGEYGPYQYEEFATGDDSTTTIYFNMSTWNPYTVVLMKSKLGKITIPTSVENSPRRDVTQPLNFELMQNYPNPFSDRTTIRFESYERHKSIALKLYDCFGREVLDLSNQINDPSSVDQLTIDNSQLPKSGIYFYRMTVGNISQTRMIVMVR